jgi:hypothetical protein
MEFSRFPNDSRPAPCGHSHSNMKFSTSYCSVLSADGRKGWTDGLLHPALNPISPPVRLGTVHAHITSASTCRISHPCTAALVEQHRLANLIEYFLHACTHALLYTYFCVRLELLLSLAIRCTLPILLKQSVFTPAILRLYVFSSLCLLSSALGTVRSWPYRKRRICDSSAGHPAVSESLAVV